MRQVELCSVYAWYTTLLQVNNRYTRQLITWAAFSYRNELHRVPARVWPGTRREYVCPACTSSLGAGTYMGGCERDGLCETEAMCQ